MKAAVFQSLVAAIYPPQCLMCDARTTEDFALCGACWKDMPFIGPRACQACGTPLASGQDDAGGVVHCDECIAEPRPWAAGRAALSYAALGRKAVMALKHGDRQEIARAAAPWLQRAARPFWPEAPLLVPVPLHRTRLMKRRFNQSALLALNLARRSGAGFQPEALVRVRRTKPLEGHSRAERYTELDEAIAPHPFHGTVMKDRNVILIDDVMTSGATFSASTAAAHAAGASRIFVLALARVHKDA